MRFWSLACLRVIALELNRCADPDNFSDRSGDASMILITGIWFAVPSTRRWLWLPAFGASNEFKLGELLTDASVHTVRTEMGVDGRVQTPPSSMTGTV